MRILSGLATLALLTVACSPDDSGGARPWDAADTAGKVDRDDRDAADQRSPVRDSGPVVIEDAAEHGAETDPEPDEPIARDASLREAALVATDWVDSDAHDDTESDLAVGLGCELSGDGACVDATEDDARPTAWDGNADAHAWHDESLDDGSDADTSDGAYDGGGYLDSNDVDAEERETESDSGPAPYRPCPATKTCRILPLGDSITWGYNFEGGYRIQLFASAIANHNSITYVGKLANGPDSVLGHAFPRDNEGHCGWTIQQIDGIVTGESSDPAYHGKHLLLELAPDIVLLHAGTNDMVGEPTAAAERLGTLIDHVLADAPSALLVVSTIIPLPAHEEAVRIYNEAVLDVVETRAAAGMHVVLADQFTGFRLSELSADQGHPTQQGYARMAEVWRDAITPYVRGRDGR